MTNWQYDEFRQTGTDYAAREEVEIYDATHAGFRNIEEQAGLILDRLAIGKQDTLIDFGAGTGTFAICAARRCRQVHAVDVSACMLDYARNKARKNAVDNIAFHHAGFLGYRHQGQAVDAIVSMLALHHLPDLWKGIALSRLRRWLRPGGQLYLLDVIIEDCQPLDNIAAFIEKQADAGGDFLRHDAETHFREEYSTYDWIIEGMLQRAGFRIEEKQMQDAVIGHYHCRALAG